MFEKTDEDVKTCYLKAGKGIGNALRKAREICTPGMKLLDFTEQVEQVVLDSDCGFGFPLNCSLDYHAAHYSSPIGDESIIPEHGLLKVDAGAHCNGYIADAAITINLGGDAGIYQELSDAAEEALNAAVEAFRPGHTLNEVGVVINNVMKKHGVKPVSNLGGHELGHFNLHAGEFVPNVPQPENLVEIAEGDAYAIEPFSTNGVGAIHNGPEIYIYRYEKARKKNISMPDKRVQQQFKDHFSTLPFSPRWITFIPPTQIDQFIRKFSSWGVLDSYNILDESPRALVAQFEHTVIVEHDGAVVTTQ
ncbi:MAG TPA: type II methionyl aminopeptidase [Candidatus Lokiarchaeia archaeon]|nr:type II methionyl aminopeptidase [Candidatus Lokiarchaeia archaeon]